jgi:hypothetical protein
MFVMPGLVPGIHVLRTEPLKDVDGRDEPGHDERISERRGSTQKSWLLGKALMDS